MRIAFAINDNEGLESKISERFGRAKYFLIVDVDKEWRVTNYNVMENPGASALSGAASKAARLLANNSVNVVVAGNFGPHASTILSTLGIKALTLPPGVKIRDAINELKRLLK